MAQRADDCNGSLRNGTTHLPHVYGYIYIYIFIEEKERYFVSHTCVVTTGIKIGTVSLAFWFLPHRLRYLYRTRTVTLDPIETNRT